MRDSDNALAHFRLGVLYYGYGRDRYADATKHLLRAVKLDPGSKVSEIAKRYLDVMRKGSGK